MKKLLERKSNFLLYSSQTSNINIDVVILDETVWLTQKSMGELFGVQRPAITKHLNNIFKEWELQENSVSSILEHTAADGKKYQTKYYNLDAIISVGYRVNSLPKPFFQVFCVCGFGRLDV
ncbi:MAG: virulence RhuM family protein [Candidatus Cloacimonetes bacterium]|nr:virulence RhuM family protein [Candidatus Cloacimonadota bacterium]MBL7149924.1 virulence RhuM family protein [Candidatus Cloacimonadota bacterium]